MSEDWTIEEWDAWLIKDANYENPDVNGFVFVTNMTDDMITGFRWFIDKPNKIGFRMKKENFIENYQIIYGH